MHGRREVKFYHRIQILHYKSTSQGCSPLINSGKSPPRKDKPGIINSPVLAEAGLFWVKAETNRAVSLKDK